MKIRSVEFLGSAADPSTGLAEGLPQVAFAGRSNVGKSSLINVVLERPRKKPARVSGTPGKTQTLNFFRVNGTFVLVDLPGYGFARVPQPVRQAWQRLVEGYLERPDGPVGVVQVVDARRDPMPQDRQMLEYLAGLHLPTLVAATKVDKLKRGERTRRLAALRKEFGLDAEQLIAFSAITGEGAGELREALEALVGSQDPAG